MNKQGNNGIFIAAGAITLAAIVLGSQSSKESPAPASTYVPKFTKGGPIEFITKMYPVALAAQKMYPLVPWQFFLTFSGLESEWGKHAPEFNYWGTKPGKGWKGQTQLLTTHEILPHKTGYHFPEVISITDSLKHPGQYDWKVKDNFRAYTSPLTSFLDFGQFLSHGCYQNALKLPEINAKLAAIKKCGYATDPDYVAKQEKLVNLVEQTVNKYVKVS